MEEYLKQRLIDLEKERTKLQSEVLKGICSGAMNAISLNQNSGSSSEILLALNFLNAQAESQNVTGNESQKEVCEHEYKSGTQSNNCDVSVCIHCGDIS